MTPLHWQMLLHYYALAAPYAEDNLKHAGSDAVGRYRTHLIEWDLIRKDDASNSGYRTTSRGEFLVKHICNLPLPVHEWRMPEIIPPLSGILEIIETCQSSKS